MNKSDEYSFQKHVVISMNKETRSRLIAGTGIALLLITVLLFYVSVPSYTTKIETKATDKRAMADKIEQISAAEIAVVPSVS